MINTESLQKYCSKFVGYGNLQSDIWFIGMEEGGSGLVGEIEIRLTAWHQTHSPYAADMAMFHKKISIGHEFFSPQNAVIQRTWNKLAETLLVISGIELPHREQRRAFQAHHLGRIDSNHALLELLPIPAPNHRQWHLSTLNIPWMACRKTYESTWKCKRELLLKSLIKEHRPKVVVMYGKGHFDAWNRISNGCMISDEQSNIFSGVDAATLYIALPHPRTSRLERWREVGLMASRFINGKSGVE